MKKIYILLINVLMTCCFAFGIEYNWCKITNPSTEIEDGEYLLCYDTGNKVKIFRQINNTALSIKKQNDTIIYCDDSISLEIERIQNNLYTIVDNTNHYICSTEDIGPDNYPIFNLTISEDYGLVYIKNSSTIWVKEYCDNLYHYSYGYLFYNITNNKFENNTHNTLYTSYENGTPNTCLYKKLEETTTELEKSTNQNTIIKIINNGHIYIVKNNKYYSLLGNLIKGEDGKVD